MAVKKKRRAFVIRKAPVMPGKFFYADSMTEANRVARQHILSCLKKAKPLVYEVTEDLENFNVLPA